MRNNDNHYTEVRNSQRSGKGRPARRRKRHGFRIEWWYLLPFLIGVVLVLYLMWPDDPKAYLKAEHASGEGGTVLNPIDVKGWEAVPNADESSVIGTLGKRVLFWEKKEGMTVTVSENDYVHKSVTITLRGLSTDTFSSSQVKSVYDENYYSGKNEICAADNALLNDLETSVVQEEDGTYTASIRMSENSILEWRVQEDEYYYYLDGYLPTELYDFIVVIDAGHGGSDEGAISAEGIYEKDLTLAYVKELKAAFDTDTGIRCYYTRLDDANLYEDYDTALHARPEFANEIGADLFVSIHMNSNEDKAVNGVEVYYNEVNTADAAFGSKQLAELLLDKVHTTNGLKNNGTHPAATTLTIVKEANMPMALIEVGYLSNAKNAGIITAATNTKSTAQAIYEGIVEAKTELVKAAQTE